MEVKILLRCFALLLAISSSFATPTVVRSVSNEAEEEVAAVVVAVAAPMEKNIKHSSNCAGKASRAVATSILKFNAESDGNLVFSPFGFSSILSLLSEGAEGETLKELKEFLQHDANIEDVRRHYQEALRELQGNDPLKAPQFKTWFYYYLNNTVDNSFAKTMRDYYFVEVKEITRSYYDWNEPETSIPVEEKSVDPAPGRTVETEDDSAESEEHSTSADPSNSKDIIGFDTLKSEPFDDPIPEKECSKFDENVDDHQYVEVPVIKQEMLEKDIEDNETVTAEEKLDKFTAEKDQDAPVKITLPLKKLEDNFEIMQAVESHPIQKRLFSYGRGLQPKGDDVASALSGNSLVGKKSEDADEETIDGDRFESKMLLFNGLYFRGSWETPFQQLRSETEDVFFMASDVTAPVTMMRARGVYKTAVMDKMDAVQLCYENKNYAMLILLPKMNDSLQDLIANINYETIYDVDKTLKPEMIQLSVPKFRLESTSRAEKPLLKSGLASPFNAGADFSRITPHQRIHLEELVQHVSFRVDEGASSENFLTASAVSRNADTDRFVAVNRPFLYFVRDVTNDIILIAGKFTNPPMMKEMETEEDQEE